MSKVWIVNYAGHDYSDATRFGELDFITKGYVSRGSLDRLLYGVAESVARSEPSDWFLPSGMILLNVLAAVLWVKRHGKIKILSWDEKDREYKPMEVSPSQMDLLLSTLGESSDERDSSSQRKATS